MKVDLQSAAALTLDDIGKTVHTEAVDRGEQIGGLMVGADKRAVDWGEDPKHLPYPLWGIGRSRHGNIIDTVEPHIGGKVILKGKAKGEHLTIHIFDICACGSQGHANLQVRRTSTF